MQTKDFTYSLNIRLSRDELEALARMATSELRDIKKQAVFSLRSVLIEQGYIPDPTHTPALTSATLKGVE